MDLEASLLSAGSPAPVSPAGGNRDSSGSISDADMMMIATFDFQAWKAGADAANPGGMASNAEGVDSHEAEEMWVEVKKQLDGGGDKSEGVKVAVRCRPFNSREKKLGAKLCCEMEDGVKVMFEVVHMRG